jgi:peptidoglycan/LPS O-acetylase OafA/YrhL
MTSSPGETPRERFVALDGLRGLAALFVLLFHVRETTPIRWLAPHGYLAVDFFFVLSGFVIAHAYRGALSRGALSPGQFIVRRFIRLWPAAAIGTLLGVFPVLVGQVPLDVGDLPKFVALGLVLIPSIGTGREFFPLNPPHWSLFDEIAANAGYALGAFRLRLRALAAVTLLAGVLTVWLLVTNDGAQYAGAQRVAYPYLAGTLAYECWSRGVRCRSRAIAWLLAGVTLAGFWVPELWRIREALLFSALAVVVFPLTVWAVADLELPDWLRRPSAIAGEASYPLYAIHYPLLLVALSVGLNVWASVALFAVLAYGVGRYIDLPLRRRLIRLVVPRVRRVPRDRVVVEPARQE